MDGRVWVAHRRATGRSRPSTPTARSARPLRVGGAPARIAAGAQRPVGDRRRDRARRAGRGADARAAQRGGRRAESAFAPLGVGRRRQRRRARGRRRCGSRARPTAASTRSSRGGATSKLDAGAGAGRAGRRRAPRRRRRRAGRVDLGHRRAAGASSPARSRVGGTPVDVALAGDAAWVADAAGARLVRVDLGSLRGHAHAGDRPPPGRAGRRGRGPLRAGRGRPSSWCKVRRRRGAAGAAGCRRRRRRSRSTRATSGSAPASCCGTSADAALPARGRAVPDHRAARRRCSRSAVGPSAAPARYRFVPPREAAFDFNLKDQDGKPQSIKSARGNVARDHVPVLHLPRPLPGRGQPDRRGGGEGRATA